MKVSSILLVLLSVSVAAVAAQTPVTVTPAPTPAATAIKTTTSPVPTPAVTRLRSCWDVSVEHDATYCITGPICSGSGAQPSGWSCPKKGDVAVADCYKYLSSYADAGKCVAAVDAECRVIKTGAWGCVWKGSSTAPVTPAPSVPQPNPTPAKTSTPTPTPTPTKTTPNNNNGSTGSLDTSRAGSDGPIITIPDESSTDDNETIQFPKAITLGATALSAVNDDADGSTNSASGTMIGVVAAIGGIGCVVAGAAFYRRHQIQQQEAIDIESAINTPHDYGRSSTTGADPPHTPPLRDSRHFFPSSAL